MARPKKQATLTHFVYIRFSRETWGRIQGEAAREKLAPSTWVRQQIEKLLNYK